MPQCVDILEHVLPPAIARELLLTGDSISAQRAYEIGLVNKVVSQEQVLSEATAMAERLCKNPPLAVKTMKELLGRSRDLNYQTGAALYQNANTRLRISEDFAEGIKAFSDKREPKWRGR
jgi:enoyl-CoA hydratase/carnithine racemase